MPLYLLFMTHMRHINTPYNLVTIKLWKDEIADHFLQIFNDCTINASISYSPKQRAGPLYWC